MTDRRAPVAVIAVLLLLAGMVAWAVAAFAVGRAGEDFCFEDMEQHRYGAASTRFDLVPPRADCQLHGPADPADPEQLTIRHPITAWTRLLVLGGLPVLWLVGTVVVVPRLRPKTSAL